MKSPVWTKFKPLKSGVDNFFGGITPIPLAPTNLFKIVTNQVFIGVTYQLRVAQEHSGWDHYGLHLISTLLPPFSAGGPNRRLNDAKIRGLIKANCLPGTYQITLSYNLLTDELIVEDSNSTDPREYKYSTLDTDVRSEIFYFCPILVDPADPDAIFKLWDTSVQSPDIKGFPITVPDTAKKPNLINVL